MTDQPTNMIQTSPERRQKSWFQESSDNKRLQESFEDFFSVPVTLKFFPTQDVRENNSLMGLSFVSRVVFRCVFTL